MISELLGVAVISLVVLIVSIIITVSLYTPDQTELALNKEVEELVKSYTFSQNMLRTIGVVSMSVSFGCGSIGVGLFIIDKLSLLIK